MHIQHYVAYVYVREGEVRCVPCTLKQKQQDLWSFVPSGVHLLSRASLQKALSPAHTSVTFNVRGLSANQQQGGVRGSLQI